MKRLLLSCLLLFSAPAFADCACRDAGAGNYAQATCPKVTSSAIDPSEITLKFNEIRARRVLALIGDYAQRRVCISNSLPPNAVVHISDTLDWDQAARHVAMFTGHKAAIDSRTIYIYR